MRFPDQISQIPPPAADTGDVRMPTAPAAVRPIGPQSPPFIPFRPRRPQPAPAAVERKWVLRPASDEPERRILSRRVQKAPTLLDQRTPFDRRRRNQRTTDSTTVIDEKA